MFKYTRPWEVLCTSMEQEGKCKPAVLGNELRLDNKLYSDYVKQSSATSSAGYVSLMTPEEGTRQEISAFHLACRKETPTMETSPRPWVIQPLSPKLGAMDLRSLLKSSSTDSSEGKAWAGSQTVVCSKSSVTVTSEENQRLRDVIVQIKQVDISAGSNGMSNSSQPSSPNTPSSTGSHIGFYSFVEEETQKTEAYLASPERQAKLTTLKEKKAFKLQAYNEERKPVKLFEDCDDTRYQAVDQRGAREEEEDDEMQERWEIIRSQAPKMKASFPEDSGDSPNRLAEEFSLRHSPTHTEQERSRVQTENVDTEGIRFSAARQQFLKMERLRKNPSHPGLPQPLPTPSHEEVHSEMVKGLVDTMRAYYDSPSREQRSKKPTAHHNQSEYVLSTKRVGVYVSNNNNSETQAGDSCGQSYAFATSTNDSGLLRTTFGESSSETPIEKEIRIVQEREERLRQERGIKHADLKEIVEIKTKPLLNRTQPKGKEKSRVSFFIQREIELESQREVDLLQQGRVLGLYDRDTPQEVEQRKRIFEANADEVPLMPAWKSSRQTHPISNESSLHPVSGGRHSLGDSDHLPSPCCPHRHPDERTDELLRSGSPSNAFYGSRRRHHLIYSDSNAGDGEGSTFTKTSATRVVRSVNVVDHFEHAGNTSKSDVPSPRYVPSSPVSSHNQRSPFNLLHHSLQTPEAIRREIEHDMKREKELRSLREASSPSSIDCSNTGFIQELQSHKLPSKDTGPNIGQISPVSEESERKLKGRLCFSKELDTVYQHETPNLKSGRLAVPSRLVSTPKGLTESLLEDFAERRTKLKVEESAYAGIQPVDDVNNEVVEATRVSRHKSIRALRWEAGIYANEDSN